jgi:hypothetical protein
MDQPAKPATSPGKPTFGPVQLDAYPRLCGLPVTVERVSLTSVAAAVDRAAVDRLPAERASRPRSAVAYLVVAVLAVVVAVLIGASVARAQAPAQILACGQMVAVGA